MIFEDTARLGISVPLNQPKLQKNKRALFEDHARRDLYGDDDGAAFRDIFFTGWEERFLDARSGAPSISSGKAQ